MTAPTIGKATSRRVNLLMLASLVIALAAFAPIGRLPAAAQPLCLDGKIWSEEAQSCVDMAVEPEPVEPIVEESATVAVETPAEVVEAPATGEEVQSTETAAPTEASGATEAPSGDGDLRIGGAPAALSVTSFGCPANFDPSTVDQAVRRATCRSIHLAGNPEVVYSLTVDGVVNENNSLPPSTGVGRWRVVPAGDWAVSQTVPPGYTGPLTVFCAQSGASAGSGTTFTFSGDGGTFLLQAEPGETWYCNSFLVPVTTGDITAYVFECPAGFDLYAAEPENLQANCDPYLRNIQFELEYSDLVSASSTNTLGRTTYANVPPGAYRLRERMPDNYGIPVVFCTVRGPSGQTLENYDRFDVSNTASIGLGMDALESVACDFFMAPGGQAYEDPGFPPQGLVPGDNATPALGEAGLQDPGFPIQGSGGTPAPRPPEETAIPDDIPAPGDLSVEDDTEVQDLGLSPAIDPAVANLDLAPGTTLLTIHNVACPENFNRADPDRGSCGPALADIAFVVTVNDELIDAATTDPGGFVFFRDVPAGDIDVKESIPMGFGVPVVSCTIYTIATGQIMRGRDSQLHVAAIDGSVVIPDVRPGEGANCGWYNVPTDASGEIMIYVNGCPENYDIYSKSPEELNADCTGQFEGTEFVLEHPTDGNSSAFATGLSLASFTNIAPGQVRLRGVMPAGYGVPVVFCQVSGPNGKTTEQYDRYDVSNNASIGLGMDQLEYVGCDFFQAPGGQPGDDIQPVDVQDLSPADAIDDDNGEDPPSATPQALPPS